MYIPDEIFLVGSSYHSSDRSEEEYKSLVELLGQYAESEYALTNLQGINFTIEGHSFDLSRKEALKLWVEEVAMEFDIALPKNSNDRTVAHLDILAAVAISYVKKDRPEHWQSKLWGLFQKLATSFPEKGLKLTRESTTLQTGLEWLQKWGPVVRKDEL